MRRVASLAASAAAALAATAIAGAARAECPTTAAHVETIAPADGATGVPVNGVVSFGTSPAFASFEPQVVLVRTSGGGVVPGALLSGPASSWIFRPDDPLDAGTDYEVTVSDLLGEGDTWSSTFTTGADTDVTDPVLALAPVLTLGSYVDPVREPDCQLPGYWTVNVDWEDAGDPGLVLYVLETDVIDVIPQDITQRRLLQARASSALTAAMSQRTLNVPSDSEVTVTVYAVDAAGRQAHTPDATFRTPSAPDSGGAASCGCTLAGPRAPAGAPLLALVAAIAAAQVRRRRAE